MSTPHKQHRPTRVEGDHGKWSANVYGTTGKWYVHAYKRGQTRAKTKPTYHGCFPTEKEGRVGLEAWANKLCCDGTCQNPWWQADPNVPSEGEAAPAPVPLQDQGDAAAAEGKCHVEDGETIFVCRDNDTPEKVAREQLKNASFASALIKKTKYIYGGGCLGGVGPKTKLKPGTRLVLPLPGIHRKNEDWYSEGPDVNKPVVDPKRLRWRYGSGTKGLVIAHAPANEEGEQDLWHILYEDGDEEDLSLEEVKVALRLAQESPRILSLGIVDGLLGRLCDYLKKQKSPKDSKRKERYNKCAIEANDSIVQRKLNPDDADLFAAELKAKNDEKGANYESNKTMSDYGAVRSLLIKFCGQPTGEEDGLRCPSSPESVSQNVMDGTSDNPLASESDEQLLERLSGPYCPPDDLPDADKEALNELTKRHVESETGYFRATKENHTTGFKGVTRCSISRPTKFVVRLQFDKDGERIPLSKNAPGFPRCDTVLEAALVYAREYILRTGELPGQGETPRTRKAKKRKASGGPDDGQGEAGDAEEGGDDPAGPSSSLPKPKSQLRGRPPKQRKPEESPSSEEEEHMMDLDGEETHVQDDSANPECTPSPQLRQETVDESVTSAKANAAEIMASIPVAQAAATEALNLVENLKSAATKADGAVHAAEEAASATKAYNHAYARLDCIVAAKKEAQEKANAAKVSHAELEARYNQEAQAKLDRGMKLIALVTDPELQELMAARTVAMQTSQDLDGAAASHDTDTTKEREELESLTIKLNSTREEKQSNAARAARVRDEAVLHLRPIPQHQSQAAGDGQGDTEAEGLRHEAEERSKQLEKDLQECKAEWKAELDQTKRQLKDEQSKLQQEEDRRRAAENQLQGSEAQYEETQQLVNTLLNQVARSEPSEEGQRLAWKATAKKLRKAFHERIFAVKQEAGVMADTIDDLEQQIKDCASALQSMKTLSEQLTGEAAQASHWKAHDNYDKEEEKLQHIMPGSTTDLKKIDVNQRIRNQFGSVPGESLGEPKLAACYAAVAAGDMAGVTRACEKAYKAAQSSPTKVNDVLREHTEWWTLPQDHDVEALRGQRDLKARKKINALHIAFPITCKVMTDEDYDEEYADNEELMQHERYSYNFNHKEPGTKHLSSDPIIADLAGRGNELMYMNDSRGSSNDTNMIFVEYWVDGWPFLFAVPTGDIEVGESLLIDYSEAYWTSKEARKRDRLMKHANCVRDAGNKIMQLHQELAELTRATTPGPAAAASEEDEEDNLQTEVVNGEQAGA